MANIDDNPIWIKGQRAGYDPRVRKWRGLDGRITTRQKALEEALSPAQVYGESVALELAPQSRKLEEIERKLSPLGSSDDWFANSSQAQPLPNTILARMKLAEYYYENEGDIAQTIDLPMEMGLQPIEVQSKDKSVEKDLQEFYQLIELDQHLAWNWQDTAVFGQCFPVEVWPRKGSELEISAAFDESSKELEPSQADFDTSIMPSIVHLSPKNMWCGQMLSVGRFDYAVTPEQAEAWTLEMLQAQIPKLMYVAMVRTQNEFIKSGRIPLNPDYCYPVRVKCPAWHRYAIPPLSKSFRTISTRQILEELIRGTIEGYKNQLWLFLLGDMDHLPSPKEIEALKNAVSGLNVGRTGNLVWRGNLKVEQHTPKPLDQVLGTETWLNLTYHIFRQQGINLRLVSGESVGRGATRDVEVDVDLLTERVKYWQRQLYAWERHIRRNYVLWSGNAKRMSEFMSAKAYFGELDIAAKLKIRDKLMPLFQAGLLSSQTTLEESKFRYEVELERKKEEQPDRELFMPNPSFSQTTVNPGTPEKEAQTSPQGRPREGVRNADQKRAGTPQKKAAPKETDTGDQNAEGSVIWSAMERLLDED